MRWLKHMTSTRNDEKVAALIAQAGPAGYGLWWMVLETVAASMENGSEKCSLKYPVAKWAAALQCLPQNVSRQLAVMGAVGLLSVSSDGAVIEVTVPNLLKYRDEYSRKSGQTPASVRSKIQIQIQSTDTETDNTPKPPRAKNPIAPFRSQAQADAFAVFWDAYWLKTAKKAAQKAYAKHVTGTKAHRTVLDALEAQRAEMLRRDPDKRPYAATWLNGGRWEDCLDAVPKAEPKEEFLC